MIGRITLPNGAEATLNDAGRWESSWPELAAYLNSSFDPRKASGVDVLMPFGRMAVSRAAESLKGQAEYAKELPPVPPGAVS